MWSFVLRVGRLVLGPPIELALGVTSFGPAPFVTPILPLFDQCSHPSVGGLLSFDTTGFFPRLQRHDGEPY